MTPAKIRLTAAPRADRDTSALHLRGLGADRRWGERSGGG